MKQSEKIKQFLLEGKTYSEICKELGCSKGTISYHAKNLDMSRSNVLDFNQINRDWEQIEKDLKTAGKRKVAKIHGITLYTLNKAIEQCLLKYEASNKEILLVEYLVKDGPYIGSNKLKKKLYKNRIKNEQCEVCGSGPFWHGKDLTLQLDHKDGDSRNNELENLRILCPNCHSQTKTYAGKNTINEKRKRKRYYK